MGQLKWYSTFVFLVGAILSFADSVTDILTLVEFYRAGHITWFAVSLTFVILPCLPFAFCNCFLKSDWDTGSITCTDCARFLLGLNPFMVAFGRLSGFVFCVKNFKTIWNGEELDNLKEELIIDSNKLDAFLEALLESTPQFIIQLYVMNVQSEPVKIIQMISLPVSLISLTWTFTEVDLTTRSDIAMGVKHKVFLYFIRLLLLSSRLVAICYFTVRFKWWILAVITFHSATISFCDVTWYFRKGRKLVEKPDALLGLPIFFFLHWLRDEFSIAKSNKFDVKLIEQQKKVLLLSNMLFAAENIVMMLSFYCQQRPKTWYTLPVTVCVSSLSVTGGITRVIHWNSFLRSSTDSSISEANHEHLDTPVQPDKPV